jgi:hypothetical protein
MKFGIGAVTALLLLVATSVDAFQVSKKPMMATVVQRQIQAANELVTRPHMAAGGAERAYGDDYYEGAFVVVAAMQQPPSRSCCRRSVTERLGFPLYEFIPGGVSY